jgi:hypothetical protein
MAIEIFRKFMILVLSSFSISFWLYISNKKTKKFVWDAVWNNSKNKDSLNDSFFNLTLRKENVPL